VGERVQGQDAGVFDLLEERQREVAGNPENFARAVLAQRAEQCL